MPYWLASFILSAYVCAIVHLKFNKMKAIPTSGKFEKQNWFVSALDILSGLNAGLFTVHLRNFLGREKDKDSELLNERIKAIQAKAREDIRAAILEYDSSLSGLA